MNIEGERIFYYLLSFSVSAQTHIHTIKTPTHISGSESRPRYITAGSAHETWLVHSQELSIHPYSRLILYNEIMNQRNDKIRLIRTVLRSLVISQTPAMIMSGYWKILIYRHRSQGRRALSGLNQSQDSRLSTGSQYHQMYSDPKVAAIESIRMIWSERVVDMILCEVDIS